MSGNRYSDEFRDGAIRQVTDKGHSVKDVASRLGINAHTLYTWLRAAKPPKKEEQAADLDEARAEIKRLKKDLTRTREERDILKKAAAYFANDPD